MSIVTNDEAARLRQDFEAASRGVKAGLPMKNGGGAAENRYSETYQRLVDAGLATPLRGRYR